MHHAHSAPWPVGHVGPTWGMSDMHVAYVVDDDSMHPDVQLTRTDALHISTCVGDTVHLGCSINTIEGCHRHTWSAPPYPPPPPPPPGRDPANIRRVAIGDLAAHT